MRILIVEDDKDLCRSMRALLEQEGYTVDVTHDGEEGLYYLLEGTYDLVLLDRMLPSMNGMDILDQLRAGGCQTPVLFLTALGSVENRVEGLDHGADDYLVKPFAYEELSARIRTIARRPRAIVSSEILTYRDIRFDLSQNLLTSGTHSCVCSHRESALLALFLRNPGQTIPRETIMMRVWGMDSEIESGNLDNYIYFLRRRLRGVQSEAMLQTVRGIGYRLE